MSRRKIRKYLKKLPLLGPVLRRRDEQAVGADFEWQWNEFVRLSGPNPRLEARRDDWLPCLEDRTEKTGFDRHYVYHGAWAARILAQTRPAKHIDIGSLLEFSAYVSAFIPVDFYDYRPADCQLSNFQSKRGDLLNLPFPDQSVASLSCMHTIEHVGLGRYGDPLDPDGDLKAMHELQRVLAPGGDLLFVTPLGKPRVCFNGHRIYSRELILQGFPELELHEFALIPDRSRDGGLVIDPPAELLERQNYGCGCFWLRRAQ